MNEKQNEQVMKSQGYAHSIENILKKIFDCDRSGFGGQIDADRIRRHPFLSITQGLAVLYERIPEKRSSIEAFIENFTFYKEMSIDYLLSFDTNTKTEGVSTLEIDKDNGLEQLEYIITCFREIVEWQTIRLSCTT